MVSNDSKLPILKCHKRPLGANMDGRTDGRTDISNYNSNLPKLTKKEILSPFLLLLEMSIKTG